MTLLTAPKKKIVHSKEGMRMPKQEKFIEVELKTFDDLMRHEQLSILYEMIAKAAKNYSLENQTMSKYAVKNVLKLRGIYLENSWIKFHGNTPKDMRISVSCCVHVPIFLQYYAHTIPEAGEYLAWYEDLPVDILQYNLTYQDRPGWEQEVDYEWCFNNKEEEDNWLTPNNQNMAKNILYLIKQETSLCYEDIRKRMLEEYEFNLSEEYWLQIAKSRLYIVTPCDPKYQIIERIDADYSTRSHEENYYCS